MDTNLANAQTFQIAAVYTAYILLILSAVCTAFMLISIAKQGDERRRHILLKTCSHTFLIYTGILLVEVIYTIFFEKYSNFTIESIPIMSLGLIAVIFTSSLLVIKRRYGN